MGILDKAFDKLDDLNKLVFSTMAEVFRLEQTEVIRLQQEQLFSGKKSDSTAIKPFYSTVTVRLKKKRSRFIVDLKDRGDFYNSLKIEVYDDHVDILTSDPKAKYLIARYGDDIIGLQNEVLQQFANDFILPQLKININEFIKS